MRGLEAPVLCVFVEADGRRRVVPLGNEPITVGGGSDNTVVVASGHVSRRHVAIRLVNGEVEVRDLGSLNGTFIDGRRVSEHRSAAPVVVSLGRDVRLVVAMHDTDDVALFPGTPPASDPGPTSPPPEARDTDSAASGRLASGLLAALAIDDEATRGELLLRAAVSGTQSRSGALFRIVDGAGGREDLRVVAIEGAMPDDEALDAMAAAVARGERLGASRQERPAFAAGGTDERHVVAIDGNPTAEALADLARALDVASRHVRRAPLRARAEGAADDSVGIPGRAVLSPPSASMRALHARLAGVSASGLPILLTGPTGVGKEVLARAVHAGSPRAHRPFRAVNSSALPEPLLEALLFGVEEGVATGVKRQKGLIREADGGTFFFDEIGDMSPALQAKLLRVLDESAVLPLGGASPVRVDVRFIAATHRDLRREIEAGRFREDLFQRLRGHELAIPRLADRPDDIPAHANAFLANECERAGRAIPGFTVAAMRGLMEHDWPGNVRELEMLVRRLVHELPDDGRAIGREDLPADLRGVATSRKATLEERLDVHRRRIVAEVVAACDGNRSRAAERLGIGRVRLRALIIRLGLEQDERT